MNRKTSAKPPNGASRVDGPRDAPTDEDVATLLAVARSARYTAYAPYSGRLSGAAVLASSGAVYPGCNVELRRLGSSMDAEQVALASAVAAGERQVVAVAVASGYVSGTTIDIFREFASRLWVYEIDDDAGDERVHVHVLSLGFADGVKSPDRARPLSIHYSSTFVSYSHVDEGFVQVLVDRLRRDDVPVWCAARDMRPDAELSQQIGDAIVEFDRMVLVISASSLRSAWVQRELELARAKEDGARRQLVIPVSLLPDASVRDIQRLLDDIDHEFARSIESRYLVDFSQWNDPALFEAEYGKLFQALRASFV